MQEDIMFPPSERLKGKHYLINKHFVIKKIPGEQNNDPVLLLDDRQVRFYTLNVFMKF